MGRQYFQPEWLESFLAVTEAGSFSAAAERLHSSQPRVSTHVAQLEAAVDRLLFDRTRRPIVLTEAGVVMASHARQVLRSLDEAADAFAGPSTGLRGTVIVGTHPSISGVYMPGLLARAAREEPDVSIELTERTSVPLVTGLVGRSLDLAVQALSSATEHPSIAAIPLWRERYVAVLPAAAGSDGASDRPMTPAELSGLDHIVIARPGNQIESEFAAALSRWGVTPRVRACTEQPNTLLNLVRLGMGVGIINELALMAFGHDDLIVRPIAGANDGRTVALVWDASVSLTRVVRRVAQLVLSQPAPAGTQPQGPLVDAMAGHRVDGEALLRQAAAQWRGPISSPVPRGLS